jgi:SAM-dependent methyltransferase
MDTTHPSGNEQARLWNGSGGQTWVEAQTLLDRMFKPLEDLLAATIPAGTASDILDVGCGTGSTTLAAARRLRDPGRAVGIDISGPMIAAARARAERDSIPAVFVQADAQTHAFAPDSVDMVISRFGVMFFDQPVTAFTNLRHAARAGAQLRFVAWRSAAQNPFMTAAERAAARLVPGIAPRRDGEPGQFAFADRDVVARTLTESGWSGLDITPLDVTCTLSEHELTEYLTRLGPLGRALFEEDGPTRARVIAAVRPAFDTYQHEGEIRFTAACWTVAARNGG